jgi:hypothetical protein
MLSDENMRTLARARELLQNEREAPGTVPTTELLRYTQAVAIMGGAAHRDSVSAAEYKQLADDLSTATRARSAAGAGAVAGVAGAALAAAVTGRIRQAPGAATLRLLAIVLSPRLDRVYRQIVADMREEYIDALASKRTRRARWIVARGHLAMLAATIQLLPLSIVKRIVELWKAI